MGKLGAVCVQGLPARFAREVMGIAEECEETLALKGIEALEAFFRSIHMPVSMKELGIEPTDEQLRKMAQMCSAAAGGKKGSAKVLYEEDMYEIYRLAR